MLQVKNEARSLLAIYGAGMYGKKAMNYLTQLGMKVSNFVVSRCAAGESCNGIPVVSYEDFIRIDKEMNVLIAIRDEKAVAEIVAKFHKAHYPQERIYTLASFIEANDALRSQPPIGFNECFLCHQKDVQFREAGIEGEIFQHKRIIGGGRRKNAVCPCCGAIDRVRWIYWVLNNKTGIFSDKCRVLHIAPETMLRKVLTNNCELDYYPGDIVLREGAHRVDVTDMLQFANSCFDYIIMNHVLEHIPDEKRALSELRRVLKDNGKLIISFPIVAGEKTYEDSSIDTDEKRLQFYGQEDHVRLYGELDAMDRLISAGFVVSKYQVKDYFTKDNSDRYGLICDDIAFVCQKN